jgi:hypothetical protein
VPAVHSVVDYALARRAVLTALAAGRVSAAEVCDAHPDLLRAARHHGEPTDTVCPVCRRERLTHVTYAYGDRLGQSAGRAWSSRRIPELAESYGQARVYVVECCRACSWNHLVTGYEVSATTPRPRRRSAGGRR